MELTKAADIAEPEAAVRAGGHAIAVHVHKHAAGIALQHLIAVVLHVLVTHMAHTLLNARLHPVHALRQLLGGCHAARLCHCLL